MKTQGSRCKAKVDRTTLLLPRLFGAIFAKGSAHQERQQSIVSAKASATWFVYSTTCRVSSLPFDKNERDGGTASPCHGKRPHRLLPADCFGVRCGRAFRAVFLYAVRCQSVHDWGSLLRLS